MFAASLPATPQAALERPVPVTVVIPTLNEADRLPACLASVAWAAEVIVVDAGSNDGTVELARAAGARVIECRGRTIGEQKNFGIASATEYWVLSVDADERVTTELRDAVDRAVRAPDARAFRVRLRNHYLGAVYMRGGWGRDWHIRLYPSTSRWSTHQVHEKLEVTGEIRDLDGFLEHDSYRDLPHQLRKATTYAEWGAGDLLPRAGRVSAATLIGRPTWRFVKTYLLQGMWKEGTRGFVFCAVHAWACFSKYAVLWDRQRRLAPVSRPVTEPAPAAEQTITFSPTVPAAPVRSVASLQG
jgi:glycosyltransferase involved in cell wall biosynthesis